MHLSRVDFKLLDLYARSGADLFFCSIPQNRIGNTSSALYHAKTIVESATATKQVALDINSSSGMRQTIKETFAQLCEELKSFEGCVLKKTAVNTVIYDGQINAKVVLIGEAPGAKEDEAGIPFCGPSGKLLDNIMHSINLSRQRNIFITNAIFWRPPGNRRPTPEEISACKPFLEKMIAILDPKLIILVGSTAVESLFGFKTISMNELRYKELYYDNCYLKSAVPVSVIFHPSYLLRQPEQKKKMWFDMLKIKALLQ